MRIQNQTGVLERSNVESEFEFKIADTSHVFNLISSGLYENPLYAIVRETLTNAFDAMVDVGRQDTPIQITLPSKLNTDLVIRDTGPGIPHAKMQEVYCTVGNSTKHESENTTGALGLGCKSPLAYRDQFAVTCFDGQEARHYSIGWNEQRRPVCVLLATVPSDDPQGLEFRIAIKPDDHAKVQGYVGMALEHINHPCAEQVALPLVNGEVPEIEHSWKEMTRYGTHVAAVPGAAVSHYGHGNPRRTYMGGIRYDGNLTKMTGLPVEQLLGRYPVLKAVTPSFFAPLAGEDGYPVVFPTAGRDSLQESERSAAWFRKQLDELQENFVRVLADQVLSAKRHGYARGLVEFDRICREYVAIPNLDELLRKQLPERPPLFAATELGFHRMAEGVIDEPQTAFTARNTDPDESVDSFFRAVTVDRPVLLVDEPYCWRVRYDEDESWGVMNTAITANSKDSMTERDWQALADRLKEYEVRTVRSSQLDPYSPVNATPKQTREKTTDPVFYGIMCGDVMPTSRFERLKRNYEGLLVNEYPQPVLLLPVTGYDYKLFGRNRENVSGYYRDMANHRASGAAGLHGIRRTEWKKSDPPSNCVWFEDFYQQELEYLSPWIERLLFAEAIRQSLADSNLEGLLSGDGDYLLKLVRPEIATTLKQLREAAAFSRGGLSEYLRTIRKISLLHASETTRGYQFWGDKYEAAEVRYGEIAQKIAEAITQQFPVWPLLDLRSMPEPPALRRPLARYTELEMRCNPVDHVHTGLMPKMPKRVFRPSLEEYRS